MKLTQETAQRARWLARVGRKSACVRRLRALGSRGIALLALAQLAALSACGAPQKWITARRTPCKPREIELRELTYDGNDEHWIAACRGQEYRCQTRDDGRRLHYSCKLQPKPAAGVSGSAAKSPSGPAKVAEVP